MKRQKVFEESVCLKCPGLGSEWGVDTWLGQGQGPHWIIHFRLILLPGPSTTQQYINSHDFVLNYEWGSPSLPSSAPQQKWWKYFNFQRRIVFLPSTVCCFQHFTFLTWVSSSQLRELWVVRASSVAPLTKLLSNTPRIHKLFLFSSQTASDYSQSLSLPPWGHLAAVNNRVP